MRASEAVPTAKRSKEDETLLNAYVVSGKKAYIVDTTTFSAGKQNKGSFSLPTCICVSVYKCMSISVSV